MILLIHILFVGIWVGCVLTEALFERALLHKGRDKEKILADLHWKVDLFIEIPAFIIVAISGIFLIQSNFIQPIIIAKIIAGLIAILINIFCVKLVYDRKIAASHEDWQKFEKLDKIQHKAGALVLFFQLLAIGLGLSVFS